MWKSPSLFLSMLAVIMGCIACAPNAADLQKPQGYANVDMNGQPAPIAQVAQAIRMGAMKKHWNITGEQPGVMTAHVLSGGHEATVQIEYNERGWIITHVSSSPGLVYNPNYNGREIIHHRYNFWVRHLNRAIENSLAELRAPPQAVFPTAGDAVPPLPPPALPAPPSGAQPASPTAAAATPPSAVAPSAPSPGVAPPAAVPPAAQPAATP
jgi:hypothetical protein